MRVLITGAAGFLGSHLADRFLQEGHDVIAIGHVAVRVGRALSAREADARALVDAADRVLDTAVVEHELERLVPLPEQFREVAAAGERGAKRALGVALGNDTRTRDQQCADALSPCRWQRLGDGTTATGR